MWEISVHNTLVSVVLNECHLPFVFNSSHIPKKCITTAAISIASSGSYVEDACDFPKAFLISALLRQRRKKVSLDWSFGLSEMNDSFLK